ncbi:hypothetical protein CLOM_g22186 [Closterium sp. NIES-68]|nr:hypothetical protein CLOM_g22186 [Closterium sp. NIES-68]GJP86228.1 hypothetical protein CLOP_g16277 [Closterium sp. NIES-67]
MKKSQGRRPPYFNMVAALSKILDSESSYLTALKPSALGGESMRPTIRGTKDEWVLFRYLPPTRWHPIFVGDVVALSPDPPSFAANSASPSPNDAASPASQLPGNAANPASPEAEAAPAPVPFVFRRVAAVAGDEMVSSQPSDEPVRIERNHFWLLADNPAVPAKEALDSRTIGPVHIRDIVGRALYVVRSAVDHEPIQNSDQATIDDAPTMAMECNIEQLLERIKEEQLGL